MSYISDRSSEIDVKITKSYDVVLPQISKCIQMSIKRYHFLPKLNVLLLFRYNLIWLRLECSRSQFDSVCFVQGKFLQLTVGDTFPTWFTGSWFSSVELVLWKNVRINPNDLVDRLIALCVPRLRWSNTGKRNFIIRNVGSS